MANWRARLTPSSNWREALVWTLALPMFLSAGTVRAARIPRIAMTTSNSTSVNADGRRTVFTKSLLPARDMVFIGRIGGRFGWIKGRNARRARAIRSHGPDHDRAMETVVFTVATRIG